MLEQNIAYYQRVVCVGLRRATKDTALIRSGFIYWQETLATSEFSVPDVVNALVEYLGFGVNEKKAFMLTLHAACNKTHDELPAVPQVLLDMIATNERHSSSSELSNQSSEEIVVIRPAHLTTTEHFLIGLFSHLGKYDAEELAECKRILKNEGIDDVDQSLSRLFQGWADTGIQKIQLPNDVDESTCKNLAHNIYLLMAEIVGPVIADRLVDKAIDDTLTIGSALRFSPRNLI
jgi:hypothetical protein